MIRPSRDRAIQIKGRDAWLLCGPRASGPYRNFRPLEPFPFRRNRNGALGFCFDAISSREPASTSLEDALTRPCTHKSRFISAARAVSTIRCFAASNRTSPQVRKVPVSEVCTDNARVPCRHLRVTNEQDTGGRRFSQTLKSWRFFQLWPSDFCAGPTRMDHQQSA